MHNDYYIDIMLSHTQFLKPGYALVPPQPSILQTVVTFGIVITLFDQKNKQGGMVHFLYPKRRPEKASNSYYAAPALFALLQRFHKQGADYHDIEASVLGGAHPNFASPEYKQHCLDNVQTAKELLGLKKLRLESLDIGGYRGRKILFNSHTGELVVAKVAQTRKEDWILSLDGPTERK